MAYFHLKLVAPRPTFPHDASAAEMAAMQAHGGYWHQKAEAGLAIAVGPVFAESGAFGLALVETTDADAARGLADADPVIGADLGFHYEISPVPSLILRQAVPVGAA